jgi:hypothetical protein
MFGPSIWVIFSIQGKNFFGSISPPRSEIDFTVTSWIGEACRGDDGRDHGHVVVVVMVMMVVVMVAIGAADMVVIMIVVEEMRIVLQRPLQVEGAAVEHLPSARRRSAGAVDAGGGVDGAHHRLDGASSSGVTRSVLLSTHDVGEGDLVLGLAAVLQAQRQVLGVDQRDDGVELGLGAHVVVHEEGLGDRHRVGEAGGLDEDGVEAAGRRIRPSTVRIRSPRTVQQMQPLFIS